ncbi:MAG: DUF1638 domain-containing protein [Caldilineaceae bacterium]|nr:DUF1638 domain-containing protein [Caldilineaceae bacterium]
MKIGIVACGAIVRELIAIANRQQWEYELTAVPAQLHNTPERIAPAVQKQLDGWAERFDLILVGYGDCGSRGALDELLAGYEHVVRIPGPHCYEFYAGDEFQRQSQEQPGTFYLTDFLARHFDKLVWRGLGLEAHPELAPLYFGNYTDLLYIQQLPAHAESERAKAAAEKLGVRYRQVESGLDELERRLVGIVEERKRAQISMDQDGMQR